MKKIYLSYRRGDTRKDTLRIFRHLEQVFGAGSVYKDLSDYLPGSEFRTRLGQTLGLCDTVLVIIGPDWLTIKDERGNPKIRNTTDSVHVELSVILAIRALRVISVLIGGAQSPRFEDLRTDISELALAEHFVIRNDPYFDEDVSKLIELLHPIGLVTK